MFMLAIACFIAHFFLFYKYVSIISYSYKAIKTKRTNTTLKKSAKIVHYDTANGIFKKV
jgi:hypothetical protein